MFLGCRFFITPKTKNNWSTWKKEIWSFEKSRSELLQSEAYKDEFVAAVGHELRTPMNAILGFNNVLLEDLQLEAKDLETVRLIRQSTDKLLKLVNQILDFFSTASRSLKLNPCPSRSATPWHSATIPSTPIHLGPYALSLSLDPNTPEWVVLDPLRVKEVLCHLIDNAFKFTAKGEVEITFIAPRRAIAI
jgi:signal transduction histidine kinase